MDARNDVTVAILAGGKGTRLGGVAKGLIEVDGVPILQRLVDRLGPLASDVLLVADDPSPYARFGLRSVADVDPGHGAPGGLHSALVHAATPWVLLVACDMPKVSVRAVELLFGHARRTPDTQWICFERDGRLEPMPGFYARALGKPLGEALPENPSFQRVLRATHGTAVAISELRAFEPDDASLRSLNTPDDLAWADALLPSGQSPRSR